MLVVLERKRSIKQKNEDETWNEPMPFNEKIKLCEVHSQFGSLVESEVAFFSPFFIIAFLLFLAPVGQSLT